MKISQPLVSIIMPAYNAENYIQESVDSIINQSYLNWELIIVNDGSADNTLSKIKIFNDKRIKILEQENRGVSSARNLGLDYAEGEFITFLDADDVLPSNSIESRAQFLESNSGVDIVDGVIQVKDVQMRKIIKTYKPYYTGALLPRLMALDSRVFFNVCYMFRKTLLNEVKFNVQMTHAEDLLFYIQLSSQNDAQYAYINEEIYWYRSGNDSAMINLNGLELGYIRLLKFVSCIKQLSRPTKILFRMKVTKIMFLSWLKQKKYKKAFNSIIKLASQ
ncbi:MAG: glycosyltransferase family 2 protein [Marinicellaceae bacterium]